MQLRNLHPTRTTQHSKLTRNINHRRPHSEPTPLATPQRPIPTRNQTLQNKHQIRRNELPRHKALSQTQPPTRSNTCKQSIMLNHKIRRARTIIVKQQARVRARGSKSSLSFQGATPHPPPRRNPHNLRPILSINELHMRKPCTARRPSKTHNPPG